VTASIIFGDGKIDVVNGVTIEKAMISAGLFPDAFLFLRNGRPIPMTTVLEGGDSVDAVRVASGG